MIRTMLEVVSEDTGLYAIARTAGRNPRCVIGPMDDRDAIMSAAVKRWPTIEHVDLDD